METVAKKVTKKDKENLFGAVESYLQLNATIATMEDQKEGLKMVVKSLIDKYPHLIENGEVVLDGVGRILEVDNRPQLISLKTGKPIVPIEAAALLKHIGKEYETKTVSVTRVSDAIEANNAYLIAMLKQQEVELRKTSRQDIKPPLKAMTDLEAKMILTKR